MDGIYTIRDIYLSSPLEREMLHSFLDRHHLGFEQDIECAVGVFDRDDTLLACGCYAGNVLKQFAVDREYRGNNFLGTILSQLMQRQYERGVEHLFVFTKPENMPFFQQNAFYPVAATQQVALLENRHSGPLCYARKWAIKKDRGKKAGAIVMNANPFTLGHRWLVEKAAALCELLYVFVVEEDCSDFPFQVRKRLVIEGTRDLENVAVCDSGPYMISAATFPTYFIKDKEMVNGIYTELDLKIFADVIAPYFHIKSRFVGSEPLCAATKFYNEAMKSQLPAKGIMVYEIFRKEVGGVPISASLVRKTIRNQGPEHPLLESLLPRTTLAWLRSDEAKPVIEKIRRRSMEDPARGSVTGNGTT
ncbi:[citrate (pro-3S)-lyase] ligase [Desulfovibrio sp.]